jgi:hypothetical protein
MTARWTVYLRYEPRGYEWTQTPDKPASWWGFYMTGGQAKAAAKRSITKVVGGKTNPADFAFIIVEPT